MLITARVALQSGARSLRSVRSAHSRAHSASRHRLPRGLAIGSAGLLAAGLVATEAYRNTISCDADRAQAEDPTRPPSGAKLDGAGEQSTVNALEDIRGQGFDVDPKKDQGKYITLAEVAQHHLAHDNWVVVDGKVFDVTSYTKNHPGGANIIVANAGRDVTELFKPIHPPNTLENNLPANSFKGLVDPEEAAKASTSLALHLPHPCIGSALAYKAEQERVANGRAALPDVETMLSLDELEEAASSFLSPRVVNYYASASLDHVSLADNRTSLNKCRLLPRIMRNVKAVRPQTKIFGVESALPIYVSPASNALLGHPDGELNITRGAAQTGIVQGISAAASYSLTDILAEKDTMEEQTGRKMGMVYQVYLQEDRSKSDELVREAVEGGCQALILTVDSNVHDFRQSNEKLKGTRGDASPGAKMGVYDDTDKYHDARQNWDDLVRLKELAQGVPIYLKGVCHIDDVRLAKEHGLAGCILSNHGGRQLDRARTGFDSLRDIHAQDPNLSKSIELYIDGGFRRGSEVLQAIALGARGVGLGRSFLWAQAAYGEKGVIRAVRILEDEIITAMRLLGITKINEIKPGMVECLQEVWK